MVAYPVHNKLKKQRQTSKAISIQNEKKNITLKLRSNVSNISSNIDNFWCWMKSEFKKEEKNVLDEAKMCWMKV